MSARPVNPPVLTMSGARCHAALDQSFDPLQACTPARRRDGDVERAATLAKLSTLYMLHRLLEPHVSPLLERAADLDAPCTE